MKTSPEHFSFTNHFNRSLLKNRIAMMNRQKSSFWALGKYAFFVGMLWLSAAFTKPYRQQIAAQIVQQVPELEGVLVEEKPSKALPKLKDFEWKNDIEPKGQTSVEERDSTIGERYSTTKYVHFRNDTLEWIVTPMTTPKDIIMIQQEFHKIGGVFSVSSFKYDPLRHHLVDIEVRIDWPQKNNYFSQNPARFYPKAILPVVVLFGTVDAKTGYTTIGGRLSRSPLYQVALSDQKIADDWYMQRRQQYLDIELREKRKGADYEVFNYSPETLRYLWQTNYRNILFFTPKGILQIEPTYQSAEAMLDGKTTTLATIERLSLDDIGYITVYEFHYQSSSKMIAVYTKNYVKQALK